jgi:hypothetical protein
MIATKSTGGAIGEYVPSLKIEYLVSAAPLWGYIHQAFYHVNYVSSPHL